MDGALSISFGYLSAFMRSRLLEIFSLPKILQSRTMALTSLLVVVCVASFANGLAHNPPRSTAGNQGFGQGWTPAPTTAPKSPHELLRRGLFELEGREVGTTILTGADQTCGYLSGSPGE